MKKRKSHCKGQILCILLALCMVLAIAPITAFAEGSEGSETTSAGKQHVLCKGNDWDISDELIMPGESFYIEPEYIVDYYPLTAGAPEVGASIMLSNAEFVLGEVTVDDSGLTKSTADTGLEPITTDCNVIQMAYANGDLNEVFSDATAEEINDLNSAIKNGSLTLTIGYVNNTNTPIRISNIKMSSTIDAGDVYGGEFGQTLLVMANYTRRSGCTITYYEPTYTLSYEGLLSGEEEGLPDHFDVQRGKQELELTNPVRPGYHFVYWNGMYCADTAIKSGDKTVISISFPCNINPDLDLTLTPLFEQGFTVTFNPNGGTIEGRNSAIYEIGLLGDEFIDIGDYVPEREGYTFEGWCSYPSADDDSLIKDTSSTEWIYQWIKDYNNGLHSEEFDIQLYAKWKKSDNITYGDSNGDGNIDMLDVLLINKYIAKQPVKANLTTSDVTGDGNVNMLDVLLIRKYIAKQPVILGPQPQ